MSWTKITVKTIIPDEYLHVGFPKEEDSSLIINESLKELTDKDIVKIVTKYFSRCNDVEKYHIKHSEEIPKPERRECFDHFCDKNGRFLETDILPVTHFLGELL